MSFLQPQDDEIRISDSPRRSPRITEAVTSPIRSIHATQMESLHSQPDMGMRTTDFFEDDSSEDGGILHHDGADSIAPDVTDLIEGRKGSKKNKRLTASTTDDYATHSEPGRSAGIGKPGLQGYHRLSTDGEDIGVAPDTASSSFRGSVEELLPSGRGHSRHRSNSSGPARHHSSPPSALPAHFRTARAASEFSPRTTTTENSSRFDRRHTYVPMPPPPIAVPNGKVEQTLGAYAIAHEITLNALMRDEKALNETLDTFALAPLSADGRQSILPSAMDPRSPRVARNFSSSAAATPASSKAKSVTVVPPPIDTTAPKRSIPADIVRTPYPFSPENVRHRDFGAAETNSQTEDTSGTKVETRAESVLTVSIAQHRRASKPRVTTLTIPATNDFTAVRLSSIGAKERHFQALDFDDAKLFTELRKCYQSLAGPFRFLSARSLSRIVIGGSASRSADSGCGWRSSRVVGSAASKDTFSEEQILRHYRHPAQGQSRYAFVQWAHRLAAAVPPPSPSLNDADSQPGSEREKDDSLRRGDDHEGLIIILSWSVRRILLALFLALQLSVAAALLWIFLGKNTTAQWPTGGFRDAGDRLGTGMAIGICVLLLGLSTIAGWLGASWLVM